MCGRKIPEIDPIQNTLIESENGAENWGITGDESKECLFYVDEYKHPTMFRHSRIFNYYAVMFIICSKVQNTLSANTFSSLSFNIA